MYRYRNIALGMGKDGQIYAIRVDESGKPIWNPLGYSTSCDVIRPVSRERLQELREDTELYREEWKLAVKDDRTDESLDDFVDSLLADYPGDENFPYKDESYVDDIIGDGDSQVSRETADRDAEELTGEPVGTWESSGWFGPQEPFARVYCSPELLETYYSHLETHQDNCNHFARAKED